MKKQRSNAKAQKRAKNRAKAAVQKAIANVHDLFFKSMHDIIGCFLVIFKFVLSRVEYSWFDWDQAYFTRETYITPEGREIRADVVCVAPFKPHIQKRFHKLGFKNIKNFVNFFGFVIIIWVFKLGCSVCF